MSNNKRIRIGSRVSTEAWRFDHTKVDSDQWSFKNFGEGWRDARLFGVVMEKIGQKWKVKWDFMGKFRYLRQTFCSKRVTMLSQVSFFCLE